MGEKRPYQPPAVVRLGGPESVRGDMFCRDGSGVVGTCWTGNGAIGNCTGSGNGAATGCLSSGNSTGQACIDGSGPVSAPTVCLAGSAPLE